MQRNTKIILSVIVGVFLLIMVVFIGDYVAMIPKAALVAWVTARSRSQSSIMSMGFFDPISICNFARFASTRAAMPCPTSTDPVKLTAATSE